MPPDIHPLPDDVTAYVRPLPLPFTHSRTRSPSSSTPSPSSRTSSPSSHRANRRSRRTPHAAMRFSARATTRSCGAKGRRCGGLRPVSSRTARRLYPHRLDGRPSMYMPTRTRSRRGCTTRWKTSFSSSRPWMRWRLILQPQPRLRCDIIFLYNQSPDLYGRSRS